MFQAENLSYSRIQIDGELNEEIWQRAVALTGLFGSPSNNVFLIKVSYWFIL